MATNEIITVQDGQAVLADEIIRKITWMEMEKQIIEENEKKMREMIQSAMDKYGVKKIDNDNVLIFIKEATTRETFQTKQFKEEHKDLYDEYVKISPVKASLTIKVK